MRIAAGAFVRPLAGESLAGDAYLIETWSRGLVVALADGLGHGAAAAVPATIFLQRVRRGREAPLMAVLEEAHEALHKTRGAVAAVARFDELSRTAEVIGLGNIRVWYARGGSEPRPLEMRDGVLGSTLRVVRPHVVDFAEGDVLVLCTDGVRSRFAPGPFLSSAFPLSSIASLSSSSPSAPPLDALAEAVVAAHGRPSDDAACLVAMGTDAVRVTRPPPRVSSFPPPETSSFPPAATSSFPPGDPRISGLTPEPAVTSVASPVGQSSSGEAASDPSTRTR
jgi:hypothetical protein